LWGNAPFDVENSKSALKILSLNIFYREISRLSKKFTFWPLFGAKEKIAKNIIFCFILNSSKIDYFVLILRMQGSFAMAN